MSDFFSLIDRAERLIDKLERLVPAAPAEPGWDGALAFRWRKRASAGFLQPVQHPHRIRLEDLKDIDEQKRLVERNTRQFVHGRPANNILLTGARGTGKSSLVKAVLNQFADQGLRLIEVDKQDLVDLPDIVDLIAERPERFILFCDDLSFDEGESSYKALKAQLDGSVAAPADNVLIYATSNRRHLMPEYMRENLDTKYEADGEIHPGESVEEKISLSERFGLWLSFYPFRQDDYLDIVAHWLGHYGASPALIESARAEALQFALQRGSRSGRVALQFARDYAGRHGLRAPS